MNKKILVITENIFLSKKLKEILEGKGCEVIPENSAVASLSKAETLGPDLIVLDIMLPAMDAVKVLRLLRQSEKTKNIEAALMSVVVLDKDRNLIHLGPINIIKKPVDFKYLQEVLKENASGKKILVVDDDSDILTLMKVKLKSMGYDVSVACRGDEALEKVKNDPPHLIIADYVIPGKDGSEIVRTIKISPETGDIPVIIFSGFVGGDFKGDNILGGKRFSGSTFSPEELAEEIIKRL